MSMATKPTLVTIGAGSQIKASELNDNFETLATAIENGLGRGGVMESPNSMQGTLDMDLNRIQNLGAPTAMYDAVRLVDVADASAESTATAQLRLDLANTTDPTLGSSLVGNNVRKVDTIADLRALTGRYDDDVVITAGYYAAGDGGGGPLRVWKTGSVGEFVDNGGSILVPTGGDGSAAWVWEWSGPVNVNWFGAKGDGVTDDSTAIAACFSFSDSVNLSADRVYFIGVASQVVVDSAQLNGPGTIRKSSAITYGVTLSGANPVIDSVTFVPEGISSQPNTDVKIADGCVQPIIRNCLFLNDIATDGALYSAITAADETTAPGTDYPYTTNVKSVLLSGNRFKGYTRPLYLLCIDGYTITGNTFTGSQFDAIRIRETIGDGNISDNEFYDIGTYPPPDAQTRDAIDTAFSGYRLNIHNNIIRNVAQIGIDIKGADASGELDGYDSSLLSVKGNNISGCWFSGIKIANSADGFIVEGNIVTYCNQSNSTGTGGVGTAGILVGSNSGLINVINNMSMFNFGRGITCDVSGAGTNVRGANISKNIVVNNTEIGLLVSAPEYAIIESNICEMRSDLDNASAQTIGLQLTPSGTFPNSLIVKSNIMRNNTGSQVNFGSAGSYVNSIFQFDGNYQEGPGAYSAGSSLERFNGEPKRQFYGTGATPDASAGSFKQGDIIWDINPVASGKIGLVCVAAGSPGTWKPFGAIDA